jgi:phage tail-like protein
MNVNGSRFELLLGRDDWGRCLDGDDERARTLGSWWDAAAASPPSDPGAALPAWDDHRKEIGIRPVAIELPATPAERPFTPDARRSACADRHGNVYRVGDDRRTLVVCSAGTRRESVFWPAPPSDCAQERERARPDFEAVAAAPVDAPDTFLALAVTADDYLVVACAGGTARAFLAFDLVAGGPPVPTAWPAQVVLAAFDMAPRHGGGVWVLDRGNRRLWELDCRLAVVAAAQAGATLVAGELEDFQPVGGAPRAKAPVTFPGGIDLGGSPSWTVDPIAIETLGEGAVLVLDVDAAAGRSRVVRLRRDGPTWSADASHWLDEMPPGLAHDFVLARARLYQRDEPRKQLFIATDGGNQVRAYAVRDTPADFALEGAAELFPLRRFGGRALVSIKDGGCYDSGLQAVAWTPIVQQPRLLFESRAEFVTPVFDSGEIATTWDRIVLDACLPPDTAIAIESRAGDERDGPPEGGASPPAEASQVVGTWVPEPTPILRSNGTELPWLRGEAARATRRESGVGAWELLLQNARGRYLQLRIGLSSANGTATPRLRALRAWSPRFSYPQRFLPAAYREDATAGPFLERWLSNIESTLTNVEDRVVNLQSLFDSRIAPEETLAWLASWFDVAFDPEWDVRRQRLFVRRAMDFFRWRGTVHGLRLALELAFDRCIPEGMFDGPSPESEGPRRIRIVEAYQTRLVGAAAAGDPGAAEAGPREVKRDALWSPDEGNAGLAERHARILGREATSEEQVTPFPLVPPQGDAAANWTGLCRSALGFVPSIGAAERARWRNFLLARRGAPAEAALPRDFPASADDAADWNDFCAIADGSWVRARWQDFLARRHRRIERLNRAWATTWPDFDVVAIPDALPETRAAQADWLQFEGHVLAMHRTAHRFSVLLPVADVTADPVELERRLGLARRIVELEKPAHTTFDVRFYWAFFRIGEARLGMDTQLGAGSRAPELVPEAVLGRAYVGASFVGGPARPKDGDRLLVAC